MTWTRRDWIILCAVTLLAAALRFYKLGVVPPGFQFDEAFNAIDAGQILDGNYPLFLPANAGREVVYSYFQAGLVALFGLTVYTLRLASALAGIAAIPATYLLLRRLLRHQSQKIAAFTSLTLAISLWHIHFSHYGIRVILMPPLLCAIFGLYWYGMQGRQGTEDNIPHAAIRPPHFWALMGSGLLTGLSVWTHPTGRFVPFVLMLYTVWLWWRYPERRGWRWDNPLVGLALTGVLAFLVFLPLGLTFYQHPAWFVGHASEVSIFAARVSGDSPAQTLINNILHVLGMFTFQGDREWAHNLAGRPVFDPLMSIPFMIGLVLWGKRLWKRRQDDPDVDALMLLTVWVLVMLAPSVFSEAAPNYSRTLPALPAIFIAAGLGLTWLANLSALPVFRLHRAGEVLVAFILVVSGGWASYDYFVRFPRLPEVYYLYDADKLDAIAYLNQLAQNNEVYLDRLWAEHPPVRVMRSSKLVKSLDMSDTLVLPPLGKGGVYAFPAEKAKEAAQLAKLWPGVNAENTTDRFGHLLLGLVKLTPEQLASWPAALQPTQPLEAYFDDGPTLLGMQTTPGSRTITLFWRAEARTLRSLTTFIHLLDTDGQRVGQVDKLPGNDSYVTPIWSPGERVIDRYYPEISDPCAGGETVRVQVGWYELAANGARRPRQGLSGDTALAGQMMLPLMAYPQAQIALPNQLNLAVDDHLTLLAAAVHDTHWQAGAPLTVDLYWHSNDASADQKISVQLTNQTHTSELWQGAVAPDAQWQGGDVVCRRLRLRLPPDVAAGDYQLALATPDKQMAIQNLTIGPSTRHFDRPVLTNRVDASFGETIRLLGYNTAQPAEANTALDVTLVWQAQAVPPSNYTVFVHLLDDKNQIVAQSDALPANGYTTERWVAGEVVSDTHRLVWPSALPPGVYHLVTGLYDAVSGDRLPVVDQAGHAQANSVMPLGEVRLPPEKSAR